MQEIRETARSANGAAAAAVLEERMAQPALRWEAPAATAATQSVGGQAEVAPEATASSLQVTWL